jgi:hypothetical protein
VLTADPHRAFDGPSIGVSRWWEAGLDRVAVLTIAVLPWRQPAAHADGAGAAMVTGTLIAVAVRRRFPAAAAFLGSDPDGGGASVGGVVR